MTLRQFHNFMLYPLFAAAAWFATARLALAQTTPDPTTGGTGTTAADLTVISTAGLSSQYSFAAAAIAGIGAGVILVTAIEKGYWYIRLMMIERGRGPDSWYD